MSPGVRLPRFVIGRPVLRGARRAVVLKDARVWLHMGRHGIRVAGLLAEGNSATLPPARLAVCVRTVERSVKTVPRLATALVGTTHLIFAFAHLFERLCVRLRADNRGTHSEGLLAGVFTCHLRISRYFGVHAQSWAILKNVPRALACACGENPLDLKSYSVGATP